MAIKRIRMRPESTNDYLDVLHPETSADVVKFNSGTTVETQKLRVDRLKRTHTSASEPADMIVGDQWHREY